MTLSHAALDRLLRKEEWLEARWITPDLIGFLQNAERSTLCLLGSNRLQRLAGEWSVGCSLEPFGPSFVADSQQLWALSKEPLALISWQLNDLSKEPKILPLPQGATHLCLGPSERGLCWLTRLEANRYQLQLLLDERASPLTLTLPEGIPYGIHWHPHTQELLLLLTPPETCPWHKAALYRTTITLTDSHIESSDWNQIQPPAPASSLCLEASYSPCGQEIFGLWQTGEWFQLWAFNSKTHAWKQLSSDHGEHALVRRRSDSRSFAFSASRKSLLSLVQERGFFRLQCLEPSTQQMLSLNLAEYTALRGLSLSPDGERLSLIGSGSSRPPTQLILEPSQAAWQVTQQRTLLPTEIQTRMVPEVLSWPSLDGELVYGFLYRDPKHKGPQPLLMPIHGGPTEQVTATWPIKAQAFVELGYAVLYVNYRGSWGYGKSYHEALAGQWGELDVADIVSALLTLSATGWIDPQRVALWGGDIGASTVLHILQRYPKVFRAAVVAYPICEFQDYYERASPLQKAELNWALGGDEPALRRHKSPFRGLHKVQTPLAVFHGAEDHLVPLAHAQRLEASLKERGVPVWMTAYPEERHSWQQRQTLEDYYCKVASFFARFLRKERSTRLS